jgi:phage shock protein E
MKTIHTLLLVASGIIAAFVIGYVLTKSSTCGASCTPISSTVSAAEFKNYLEKDHVVLLDVRTKDEYTEGHIDKSTLIDFNNTNTFQQYISTLDKNKTYLLYCRSGNRSGQARKYMESQGFTQVMDLSGGIASWQKAGYTLTK